MSPLTVTLSFHSLTDLYPALSNTTVDHGKVVPQIPLRPAQQALNQFYAGLVTVAIAVVGGIVTGENGGSELLGTKGPAVFVCRSIDLMIRN